MINQNKKCWKFVFLSVQKGFLTKFKEAKEVVRMRVGKHTIKIIKKVTA